MKTKQIAHGTEPEGVDLGRWLGRREAFAAVAGRCSAAEAQSLRTVRDSKLYKKVEGSWEEFCKNRLGVSRRHVDRILRVLDEFGPEYFHIAQMTHVTAEEYRAIAPHIGPEGVRMDGAVVALLPENSEQVSSAVSELLRREKPQPAKPAPSAAETVLERCEAAAGALRVLEGVLDRPQQLRLCGAIACIVRAAADKGVIVSFSMPQP